MRFLTWFGLFAALILTNNASAEGKAGKPTYIYFGLEPNITTNYISENKKIGFVNVAVELMTAGDDGLDIIEKHQPLIRDKIISILGHQSPQRLRSLSGREEVRLTIQNEVNTLLKRESGVEAIEKVLFTKFLLM